MECLFGNNLVFKKFVIFHSMHNNALFFITKYGIHTHQTNLVLGLILELKLFRNVFSRNLLHLPKTKINFYPTPRSKQLLVTQFKSIEVSGIILTLFKGTKKYINATVV